MEYKNDGTNLMNDTAAKSASHCQARLEEARMKVEKIKVPGVGAAPDGVSNFDMDKS
jgi:exonuclease VII small subunit